MTATELHLQALEILREAIGERASEVYLSASCRCYSSGDQPTLDYTVSALADKPGEKFNEHTGCGGFIETPEKCLGLFRRDVLPALCQFMGLSGCAEYDPIAMGA